MVSEMSADKITEDNNFIPLLRAEYFAPFIARLKDFDNNIYPLLDEAGLPETVLSSEHEYFSEKAIKKLLTLMYNKLGEKRFALWLEQVAKSIFVPQHLAKLSLQGNIKETIIEFIYLVNHESKQTNIQLKTSLGKVWFARLRLKKNSLESTLAEQFAITMMIELIRVLTQSHWVPEQVALQSATEASYLNELKSGASQVFYERRVSAVSISAEILNQPVKYKKGWQQILKPISAAPNGFIESLTQALTPYLSMGRISVTTAADLLGLSVRTLQRRLTEEGVSYSKVIEEIWFTQAKSMLVDRSLPITQISSTLGYADVAHFSRAFKRLAGISPRAFRNNQPQ